MFVEKLLQAGGLIYVAASVWLLIYGLNAYVLVGLMLWHRRRQTQQDRRVRSAFDPKDHALPRVTTQLPIFNEKHVVARLLNAACALDYPPDRHEIQVLDDSTDETGAITAALVATLRAAGHDIHHLRREHRQGYKAGALAAGLKVATGEFVAIFDADFVPEPDFLRNTIPFLLADPRCCFVQTRWGHRNRSFSLLTELQSIGIDGHFVVEQPARAWQGMFCNFNGTAGVWRTAAIADAGGWRADTLTEDLDLSYRAMLRGWRPHYLLDCVTPAEVPIDINAFKAQQRRWATGSIQCALKLLPQVLRRREIGIFTKVQACLHLTHYLIHPLILIMTLLVLPLVLARGVLLAEVLTLPLAAVVVVALLGPSTLYVVSQAVTTGRWQRALLLMPLLIGVGIGLAFNNTLAVGQALLGHRNGEFVRTPKLGAHAESGAGAAATGGTTQVPVTRIGDYRPPRNRIFVGELFMGAWAFAACAVFTITVGPGSGLLVAVQAIGFTAVGSISAAHRYGRGLPSLFRHAR